MSPRTPELDAVISLMPWRAINVMSCFLNEVTVNSAGLASMFHASLLTLA